MKDLARELAELWPERFEFVYSGGPWRVTNKAGEMRLNWLSKPHNAWAFWGPLAEELGVKYVTCWDLDEMACRRQEFDTGAFLPDKHASLLEALASACLSKVREVRR